MQGYKASVKALVGGGIRLLPPLQRRLTRGLTVFLYHDVTDYPSAFATDFDLAVSVKTFRRQITWIRNNYSVIHARSLAEGNKLPENAALISFDDGFRGSFDNGISLLKQWGLPSIVFLNMRSIAERRPLIAALAAYLERFVPDFAPFARAAGASAPFHLSLNPRMLELFEQRFGPQDMPAVARYQGACIDPDALAAWAADGTVAFGSHLFDHWNAPALTEKEFEEQYASNETSLGALPTSLRMLAFPNGRYSRTHLALLQRCGAARAFSSSGGVPRDPGQFLLDRCSLYEADCDESRLWFRVARASTRTPQTN
ncbi:MAG: polysaccharide deacetylase family protein [Gemmatimonadetes bacterium]|nr:polysaccharide deacetylase family protein [Gemmatimonadota bacterium]